MPHTQGGSAAIGRIEIMDVLRGWALLGILLMNIEAFAGPMRIALVGLDPSMSGLDRWVDAAVAILVQGKFFLLFSLLFGMGFAVMMDRARSADRPFVAAYLRRILALLAIGLVHLLVIWSGDILTLYALLGLVLLVVFRRVPTRFLPWLALAAHAVTWKLSVAPAFEPAAAGLPGAAEALASHVQAGIAAERLALGAGSFADAVAHRISEAPMMLRLGAAAGGQIIGMFLLGMWCVRSGAMVEPLRHRRLYAGLRWIALPVGLAMALLSFRWMPTQTFGLMTPLHGAATLLSMIGALLISLGYLAWLQRGLDTAAAPILRLVAPAGRMALTHYLLQSLVCTFVFCGYGLGYFERLPRAWQVPFAIALFAVQVGLSHAWLARYRLGPAEWLWRAVTDLRWPQVRHAVGAPPAQA